jgi:DNA-binding transcriptional LysR family regulator
MDFSYLETYVDVIKLGSFTKAAKKLYLSKPAISFRVKKLEQELGISLIVRNKKNFYITSAGKRLFSYAEQLVKDNKNLFSDLNKLKHGIFGELTIVTSTYLGECFLPSILSEFRSHNPSVALNVIFSGAFKIEQTIIEKINDGAQTIGFCNVAPKNEFKNELQNFKLGEDEIILIAYPGHHLLDTEITISDLMGESIILREEPTDERHSRSHALIKAGFKLDYFKPRLVIGSTLGIITAVQSKMGIAFVPYMPARHWLELGLVKQIKIKDFSIKQDFFCIHQKSNVISPLCEDFLALIKSYKYPRSLSD